MQKSNPNKSTWYLLGFLFLIGCLIASFSLRIEGVEWPSGFLSNLSTEIFGALLAYFIFDRVIGALREQKQAEKAEAEEKIRLIQEMGSGINVVALRAVEVLRIKGWLYSLQTISLNDADLHNANLSQAQLQKSNLVQINLQNAILLNANLENSKLLLAKLQNVTADGINLKNSMLFRANLKKGRFARATFIGANLTDADLQGTSFFDCSFDISTILPDGSHWTPEADMGRFTDPAHPDFWQPDWVKHQ